MSPSCRRTNATRSWRTPTCSGTCRARRSDPHHGRRARLGTITPETTWPYETEWCRPDADPIMNYGGTSCGGDLAEVFRRSCNIPFAQIAVEMGPDEYPEYIDRW
ncbi:MAG: penicillin-binding transpeptidase domain-containing protein [Ilumatobacteraceae bacterium]